MIKILLSSFLLLKVMNANADEFPVPDENFMLVLREIEGLNKQEFGFKPTGPATATLTDGKTITVNNAWFDLIGDMHIRFVIDGELSMHNLTAEQFNAFGIIPEKAVEVAIKNIKKRYGTPKSVPWQSGVMMVSGKSPDLDSSYFLDKDFWIDLLKKYPDGVIVGVPKRGGLIYAPISDKKAVTALDQGIRYLYESSSNLRVSSALYMFKDDKWSVYRKPLSLD